METVFIAEQTLVNLEPPLTNVSTYQKDPNQAPYMMAIELLQRDCYTAEFGVTANLVEYLNNSLPSWYRVDTPIPLEFCTAEHMVNLP
jgi:hypothetical protein